MSSIQRQSSFLGVSKVLSSYGDPSLPYLSSNRTKSCLSIGVSISNTPAPSLDIALVEMFSNDERLMDLSVWEPNS